MQLGVDYVECDVRTTRDGAMVIAHDAILPSGIEVSSSTMEQYAGELGDDAATLGDVIGWAAGRVRLHVDLKETASQREPAALLMRRLRPDGFVLTSLEDSTVLELKELFSSLRVGLTLGRDMAGRNRIAAMRVRMQELFPDSRIRTCRPDFLAVNIQLARLRLLNYGAHRGIPIWLWTVDDVKSLSQCLRDARVATVITNRPDIAVELRPPRVDQRVRSASSA